MPGPKELTLIVAATKEMGIGLGGKLPWTGLRKEMAYFKRVTGRVVGGEGVVSFFPSCPPFPSSFTLFYFILGEEKRRTNANSRRKTQSSWDAKRGNRSRRASDRLKIG